MKRHSCPKSTSPKEQIEILLLATSGHSVWFYITSFLRSWYTLAVYENACANARFRTSSVKSDNIPMRPICWLDENAFCFFLATTPLSSWRVGSDIAGWWLPPSTCTRVSSNSIRSYEYFKLEQQTTIRFWDVFWETIRIHKTKAC